LVIRVAYNNSASYGTTHPALYRAHSV
jgi:hypothetical protein